MLKYQVRTLGREKRRQTGTPLRDVFTPNCATRSATSSSMGSTENHGSLMEDDHLMENSDIGYHHTKNYNNCPGSFMSTALPAMPMRSISQQHNSGYHYQQNQQNFRTRGRSTSVSSLSSSSSSSDPALEWGQVRVYTYLVRPDTTYFTFLVNNSTTADDLVQMALVRLRLYVKDYARCFCLGMELVTRQLENNNEVKNVLILEQLAKPLELQACHPKEKSKFFLQNRLNVNF